MSADLLADRSQQYQPRASLMSKVNLSVYLHCRRDQIVSNRAETRISTVLSELLIATLKESDVTRDKSQDYFET